MSTLKKIKVKIITGAGWYTAGEEHEVGNYLSFDYSGGAPHFEKDHHHGISLEHCVILSPTSEKTYELDGVEYSESSLRSLIKKATS